MKKLFIYSSFTGNGDLVAEEFKKKGYEIRKVIEKKKFPKSFFFSIMSGGFRAGLGLKAKLVNYDNNVKEFDEIVLGSPIWNGRFPPTTNSILKETDFAGKSLQFLLYSGSGEGKKALKKVKKMFPNSEVTFLQEPKKHKDELKKLSKF
jgi:flavodoxin